MKQIALYVLLGALAFAAGLWWGGGAPTQHDAHDHGEMEAQAEEATVWTCSMHPQIRQPQFGACPLCGMDLIPVDDGDKDEPPRTLTLSEHARSLAEIQVAPVERRFATAELRMVGKVAHDETRLHYVTARVAGRLDRLYVDYTGVPVQQGDHLVEIYSPELIATQQALLEEQRRGREFRDAPVAAIREGAARGAQASRERLRLWGLNEQQIADIESRGEPLDHLTIHSPIAGIVVEKEAVEGMYVDVGTRIYTVADLSRVWVLLDAYESDLAWLRFGQSVQFYTEAYPGEPFQGRVVFIDPVLNDRTRTVRTRVNVPNFDGRLKPGMFVRAVIQARVTDLGKVVDDELAGKWISPMHPEIVKDGPGSCDICGMPLVRAETLGYVSGQDGEGEAPLVIPASAPLITGKRALVYVQQPDDSAKFQGREVVLGPRVGEEYIVREGLEEGERVVTHGNFKIDSALQLRGQPSMMSPQEPEEEDDAVDKRPHEPVDEEAVPDDFRNQVDAVLDAYFVMQGTLSQDQAAESVEAADALKAALGKVEMGLLEGKAHDVWMRDAREIEQALEPMDADTEIEKVRGAFHQLSQVMDGVARNFAGHARPVLRYHCPMAFDWRGADWLQDREGVENPYFGSTMFRCGTLEETIVAAHD